MVLTVENKPFPTVDEEEPATKLASRVGSDVVHTDATRLETAKLANTLYVTTTARALCAFASLREPKTYQTCKTDRYMRGLYKPAPALVSWWLNNKR